MLHLLLTVFAALHGSGLWFVLWGRGDKRPVRPSVHFVLSVLSVLYVYRGVGATSAP